MFALGFEDCIGVWQQRTVVLKTKWWLRGAMAAAEKAVLASQSSLSQNTPAKTALRDSFQTQVIVYRGWKEPEAKLRVKSKERTNTCVLPVQPPSYSYTV